METSNQEEAFNIRNHITNSIDSFKETLECMKKCRNDLISEKNIKLKEKKDRKRTEKLFTTKLDGLNKKPEFTSTVASQYILYRDYFSKITFLEHGPMMDPREKEALLAPDRVYDKGKKWIPTDDVIYIQRHMFFEDSLPPPPTKVKTIK